MRYFKIFCVLALLILLVGISTQAQDGTLFELSDTDVSIQLPADWKVVRDDGYVYFQSEDGATEIFPNWYLSKDLEELEVESGHPEQLLPQIFAPTDETLEFDESLIETIEVNGVEMLSYTFEDTTDSGISYTKVMMVFEMSDGVMITAEIYPFSDSEFQEGALDTALEIMASAASEGEEESNNTNSTEDGTRFELSDTDVSIQLPADWKVVRDDGYVYFQSEDGATEIFPDWYLSKDLEELDVESGHPEQLLPQIFAPTDETLEFDESLIETIEVNGVEMLSYTFEDTTDSGVSYTKVMMVFEMSDGVMITAEIYPFSDSEFQEGALDTALEIMASAASEGEEESNNTTSTKDGTLFELSDTDISIQLPADWKVVRDDGYVYFQSEDGATEIFPNWYLSKDLEELDVESGHPEQLLPQIFAPTDETLEFDESLIETIEVNDVEMLSYTIEDTTDAGITFTKVMIVFEMSDGVMITAEIYPFSDSEFQEGALDTALEIMASATTE